MHTPFALFVTVNALLLALAGLITLLVLLVFSGSPDPRARQRVA
jgi:hypothetical protein